MSRPNRTPVYRPDIDGLRAIAVAAVVFFHAGVPGFSGGYVGVDIFFVISGFLITQVLAGVGAAPLRISLTDFYVRRGRRILPALIVTSMVATVGASALLLPWDLERFGKYLAATSVLSSNIPAWAEQADYFDSRVAYVPLTHFWSIAVEEQFYLLYPLILISISKLLPRRRFGALVGIAGVSFAACVWASYHRPLANFFLAPTRGWELLLGAALATNWAQRVWHRLAAESAAAASLVALAVVVHCYVPTMRYPGLYTIVPCAATAVLILTGCVRPTRTHRLLARRPLVFTGLISFSLYLWHLPILLLFTYYHIEPVGAVWTGALLAIVYLAATLSWKFVERPVRTRTVLRSDRSFLKWAVTADAIMLLIGILLWNSDGFPRRFPRELAVLDQNWMASSGSVLKCVNMPIETIAAGGLCSYGPQTDTAPRALVWGDSHAMALLPAYERLAISRKLRLYIAVKPGCRPLVGVTNSADNETRRAGCARFNAAVIQAIERLQPSLLILNAHWIDTDSIVVTEHNLVAAPGSSNFRRALEYTLLSLGSSPHTVCAVLDVPTFKYSLPYAVGMARRRGISEDFLQVRRSEALQQYRGPEQDFGALRQNGMLRTADPKDVLCRASTCTYEAHDALLYADRDHLSTEGALFVSDAIDGCFVGVSPTGSR